MLSSHILADVEEICDRVSIMTKGKLKSVFDLKDIPSLFGQLIELTVPEIEGDAVLADVEKRSVARRFRPTAEGGVNVFQFNDPSIAQEALKQVSNAGLPVLSFQTLSLRLEDIFVKMTAQDGPADVSTQPATSIEGGAAR